MSRTMLKQVDGEVPAPGYYVAVSPTQAFIGCPLCSRAHPANVVKGNVAGYKCKSDRCPFESDLVLDGWSGGVAVGSPPAGEQRSPPPVEQTVDDSAAPPPEPKRVIARDDTAVGSKQAKGRSR